MCRHLRHRLHHSDLVIDPHHRADADRIIDDPGELVDLDEAIAGDRQHPALRAFAPRLFRGREHRLVLDWRRGQRAPALLALCTPGTQHSEVVALGAAAGEDDLVGMRAETVRNALARLVERDSSLTSPAVRTGGIPEAR